MSFEEIIRVYDRIHSSMEERIKDRVDCNKIRRYFIKN